MTSHRPVLRLLSVMLAVVLLCTFAAPARAEAFDFFLISAVVGAAIVVLILIVYLIVANAKGSKMDVDSKGPETIKIACIESATQPRRCWAVDNPEQSVNWDSVVVVSQPQPQS